MFTIGNFAKISSIAVICGPIFLGCYGTVVAPVPANSPDSLPASPAAAIDEIHGRLRSQGFRMVGAAVLNRRFEQGDVIAYTFDAGPGSCYIPIAVGSPGVNLNMTVVDATGQAGGQNVAPDRHPWVQLCVDRPVRFMARLQMTSGRGEYVYALFQGRGQANLASLPGPGGTTQAAAAIPATPTPVAGTLDPETRSRLHQLDSLLVERNYRRVGEPRAIEMATGQDRNFPVTLRQGLCYAFATLGGPGARDTDVFVIDETGRSLAQDIQTGVDALVNYCPGQSGQYLLRTRMYDGSGSLFIAGYVQTADSNVGPDEQPVITGQGVATPGLEENFDLLQRDIQARGYEPMGDPTRGQLDERGTYDFPIRLEGGQCYAVLAVGDNRVRDLDLLLLNSTNQVIDRDIETDARPVVRVCPRSSGTYRMRVRMYAGRGNFVYAAYRWPRGTSGPFGLRGLIYVRLAEVTQLLQNAGYAPDFDHTPGQGTLASQGARMDHTISLDPGQCYALLVVGGDGVGDLDIALHRGNTSLGSDGSMTAFPTVEHCMPADTNDRQYVLKIEARTGQGQYFYQIFRRQ